jgi:type VI secretion system secreted protein VgrG
VQFHWDREGKNNESSSCFVRVSTAWAGASWGAVHIPRIGQEVIVSFLEGDPDLPLVTGSVYNAMMMPPYDLPANAMVSGVKTNTTPGGDGYNELSMDDTKGKELITIHAQFDMDTTVEHDRRTTVGNDRTESIGKNESLSVGKDRSQSVADNENIDIGKDQAVTVRTAHGMSPKTSLFPSARSRV